MESRPSGQGSNDLTRAEAEGPGGGQASGRQEGPSLSHPLPFLITLFSAILVPQPGIEPAPLALRHRVLIPGLAVKFLPPIPDRAAWAQRPGWGECESKTDLRPDLDRGLELQRLHQFAFANTESSFS